MYTRKYHLSDNQSYIIFGPRATGKTTWLIKNFPEFFIIDLLNSEIARKLIAFPEKLEMMIPSGQTKIIIDEIQRSPELLNEVHRLIESKKFIFILTGSSARKLKRGGANLLAGRAIRKHFFPLTCWEIGSEFNVTKSLNSGLLPLAWGKNNYKEYLSTYIYTYLREEVLAEGLIRNYEAFNRFLEISSFSQAMPITNTTIASDVGVDSKLIASYFEILEDLLIATRIPVFTKRAKRRLTSHPKFFLFDVGVYRSLRPKGPLDSPEEIDGAALETLFFQHHQALMEFSGLEQKLYFWKTAKKIEVDFVSYGEAGIFAFEIKRSSRITKDDLQGLKLFKKDYPEATCFFCYGGDKEYEHDGVKIVNFEKILLKLPYLITDPL